MSQRPPRDSRPALAPAPRNNYNSYFISRDGIDREVITADICRYLGNDALVRPGVHNGAQGYFVTAYRNLTSAMIEDLKADSARWDNERRRNAAREVTYTSSDTYQSRQRSGPTDDPPYGGGGGYPHHAQPPLGNYQSPQQQQQQQPPYPPSSGAAYPPSSYPTSGGGPHPPYPPSYSHTPASSDPRYPPYGAPSGYPGPGGPDMDVDMGADMGSAPYVSTGADFAAARGNLARDSRDAWADSRMQRDQVKDPRDQPGMMRDPRDPRDMRDPRDIRDPRDVRDPRDPRDAYMMRGGPGDAMPPSGPVPPQGAYDRNGVPIPGGGYPGYGQMNPGLGPGPVTGSRPGDYMQQQPPPGAYGDASYSSSIPHDPLYGRAPYQDKGGYPASRMSNPRATSELTSPPGKGSTTPTMDSQQDFDPSDPVARRSAQSPNVSVTPSGSRRSEERNQPRDRDRDSDRERGPARRPPPPQHPRH